MPEQPINGFVVHVFYLDGTSDSFRYGQVGQPAMLDRTRRGAINKAIQERTVQDYVRDFSDISEVHVTTIPSESGS